MIHVRHQSMITDNNQKKNEEKKHHDPIIKPFDWKTSMSSLSLSLSYKSLLQKKTTNRYLLDPIILSFNDNNFDLLNLYIFLFFVFVSIIPKTLFFVWKLFNIQFVSNKFISIHFFFLLLRIFKFPVKMNQLIYNKI